MTTACQETSLDCEASISTDGMSFSYLPNLERAGFICGTSNASAMQVINITEEGDTLVQRSCLASVFFSSVLK